MNSINDHVSSTGSVEPLVLLKLLNFFVCIPG